MWSIITFLFVGFLAGLIARALVSGPSPSGLVKTTVLGLVGSLVGGFIGYVIFDKDLTSGPLQWSGFLGSVVGAVIVLLVYRRSSAAR
ncbi:GlsB/YeaQ/YmgE family stress response membrane protein [Aquihabitans sp. G128]|uniref:GlsB/YeaQ/YmgE family stress response membrane protein n=1 Tax=Aquihabitans sp. G128 TaxID=2849779 RepID=UPI001C23F62C|nr:GlsB/YeaQ/YmgE family stress response membrane protein [Aquihabitans sp. G128]QXC59459.1 GlsB/YeaQ/YmgE family stress response membrane protein [Aquihabitans sp. G128]